MLDDMMKAIQKVKCVRSAGGLALGGAVPKSPKFTQHRIPRPQKIIHGSQVPLYFEYVLEACLQVSFVFFKCRTRHTACFERQQFKQIYWLLNFKGPPLRA